MSYVFPFFIYIYTLIILLFLIDQNDGAIPVCIIGATWLDSDARNVIWHHIFINVGKLCYDGIEPNLHSDMFACLLFHYISSHNNLCCSTFIYCWWFCRRIWTSIVIIGLFPGYQFKWQLLVEVVAVHFHKDRKDSLWNEKT